MPTVAEKIDFVKIAEGCGYPCGVSVDNFEELNRVLNDVKMPSKLSFIEVKSAIGAREDLGRPTLTAKENKENFMREIKK